MTGPISKIPDRLLMLPDRGQARAFLKLLDSRTERFTFQTFDDNADRKDPKLARILHGTLDECWDELVRLSRAGAGVFVTINCTDFSGRGAENITEARAIWQDDDKGVGWEAPLEMAIEVQTSTGRYQRYLLVDGLTLEQHDQVMAAMVERYGNDPKCTGRNRVLRLPGFPHQKDPSRPFMVTMSPNADGGAYSGEDVIAAFSPLPAVHTKPAKTEKSRDPIGDLDTFDAIIAGRKLVAETPLAEKDYRNSTLYQLACAVLNAGNSEEQCLETVRPWGAACGLSEAEISKTVQNAWKYCQQPPGSRNPANEFEPLDPLAPATYISRCLADVEREPVTWLWHNRIALGKIAQIAGEPKRGKSQLTCALVAAVTTGGHWPDGSRAPLGSAVVISCEDDLADTVGPRCDAAGADSRRIHVLDWVLGRDPKKNAVTQLHFDIGQHTPALRQLIEKLGDVKLIVIDPISAYLGRVNSYVAAEVRQALAPVAILAAEYKIAVVLVSHLNKNSAERAAANRVGGSGAFVAVARSNWLVAYDPDDEDKHRRLFAPIGANIGDGRTGFAFTAEGVDLPGGISTSRVVFEHEPIELDADELVSGPDGSLTGRLAEAAEFLKRELASGPQAQRSLEDKAKSVGIAKRTLRRASKQLDVMKRKNATGWRWSLTPCADDEFEPLDHDAPPSPVTSADDEFEPLVPLTPVLAEPEYDFG